MYTIEELRETAVLNALVLHKTQTYDELKEALEAHGIDLKETDGRLSPTRVLCRNLEKRFRKYNISLFEVSPTRTRFKVTVTKEAIVFCAENLLTGIYDEEGFLESKYIQHPVALEREMLI